MEQRRFGNSGLSVSVLSFGTMTVGGRTGSARWAILAWRRQARILDVCREAGVTTIDHGRRVFVWRLRGDPRRGVEGPA